ncbi:PadR family transcriptional regulator [Dictyobacter arantiisoli]|uniref:PadR family transcriptional regulator n=1 Tax=Dictyobacter arantiisoli TaxID=2014874 RepID=UPI0011ECE3A6|nr:PadR family transcriptional regulator [Dictyobacter arantiisoli]
MDERSLLLLGMLKSQSQHGYQINEFIEKNLSRMVDMKRSTAYTLLERLCDQGYVDGTMEQAGNRPQKKVYTITPTGEQKFFELLHEYLKHAGVIQFPFDIGLMFLDSLPDEDVSLCLQGHLQELDRQIVGFEQTPRHGFGRGVDLAVEHRLIMSRAERDWVASILQRFQSLTDE